MKQPFWKGSPLGFRNRKSFRFGARNRFMYASRSIHISSKGRREKKRKVRRTKRNMIRYHQLRYETVIIICCWTLPSQQYQWHRLRGFLSLYPILSETLYSNPAFDFYQFRLSKSLVPNYNCRCFLSQALGSYLYNRSGNAAQRSLLIKCALINRRSHSLPDVSSVKDAAHI